MLLWPARSEDDPAGVAPAVPTPETGTGNSAEVLTSIADVEAFLARDEHSKVVVLYVRPDLALASALVAGSRPVDAVGVCEEWIVELLALVRHDRRRFILVEETAGAAQPKALARVLEARLGATASGVVPLPAALPPQPPRLYRALAALAFLERPDLRQCAAELQASTVPLGPERRRQWLWEGAFGDLAALEAEARGARRAARLAEKNRRLRDQLRATRARLAAVHASSSWRLTRPLRVLKHRLRALAGGGRA